MRRFLSIVKSYEARFPKPLVLEEAPNRARTFPDPDFRSVSDISILARGMGPPPGEQSLCRELTDRLGAGDAGLPGDGVVFPRLALRHPDGRPVPCRAKIQTYIGDPDGLYGGPCGPVSATPVRGRLAGWPGRSGQCGEDPDRRLRPRTRGHHQETVQLRTRSPHNPADSGHHLFRENPLESTACRFRNRFPPDRPP